MTNPTRDQNRRTALMAARTIAIANRDWTAMNEITKRIAKIDPPGWKPEPKRA